MWENIFKIGATLGFAIGGSAIANILIGAALQSPDGGFQDHLNAALSTAFFIPLAFIVIALIGLMWSKEK